ncbi:pentapeptide repeat-containing protein, partial [Pseudanabaenaceae cyanobacterium LEGE 13415]|nr:pentapeptide repeat-containing protein [Pseudanabaenaceae cyanobacterium LEGE 13415]
MSSMKGLICSVLVLFASWMMFASPVLALSYSYNRESLIGADFSNKDLTDSEFTKANM